MTEYDSTLEVYSLEEVLELNDKTPEEALEYLVTSGYISLPDVRAMDFE